MNEFRDVGGARLHDLGLDDLAWAPAENFLGLPEGDSRLDTAAVVILPVPYEATVSYMGGTRFGPRGILHASRYVELYDHELDSEPYRVGIHTLPELMLSGGGPEAALATLRRAMDTLLETGKFVVMLGGEHSISGPAILSHADRVDGELSVLQLDAHADLREEYEGSPLSHACVMYRVHDRVRLAPVGIRSLTREERELMHRRGIVPIWGHEIEHASWVDRVLDQLGDDVYVTVDVDYFDPSVVPATGTPEPGGGSWYPALELLSAVFREKRVVGCDVVEFAPLAGHVASDFLVAKLVYKLIGLYGRSGLGRGR